MARGIADQETYQPRVMPEDLPRKVVPEMSGNSIGSGITHIADALQAKYQSDSATYAGDEIAKARVKAVNDLKAAQDSAPPGDQTGFTAKYLADFDKNNANLVQNAGGNKIAGQMIGKGLSDLRDTLGTHSLQWESQQNVAYRKDSVVNNTEAQLAIVEAHPELKQQVGSTLFDQIRSVGGGNETMLPLMRGVDAKLSLAAANGLTRQNPQGMYDALTNPEKAPAALRSVIAGLNDQQLEVVRAKAQSQISSGYANSVVDAYRTQGPQAGGQALASIDKLSQPPEILAQIRADAERGVAQWHHEAEQTHQQDIISLESRLSSGQTTPDDVSKVYALHNKGVFTAETAGNMIGRIQKAELDKIPDTTYRDYVAGAVNRGQALDPMDKDLRGGMDAAFKEATQGLAPGSPGWINRGADMARRTGIVPDSMVGWSRTQIVSGDPATAASAAQTLSRLSDADPRGLPYAIKDDKETASMAKMINDAVTAGADAKTAVENARSIIGMPDAQKLALEESYKKNKVAQSSLSSLQNLFEAQDPYRTGTVFHSVPAIPPAMLGQYEQLRQDYYKTTGGNVQQASALAQANLKNVWGISEVNGTREFMMYAPEAQNAGLATDTVQKAMQAFATGHTDDPSKVHLTPSVETATTNGQQWNVSAPDKFGAYGPLLDKRNNPLIFTLPTATRMLKSQATAEILDKMENERKLQVNENMGQAWLHEGLLKEQQEEDRIRNANPKGQEFVQGRRGGY